MKKLKFILLILVSIFCLNSCFTIATMQGEGLLPPPEYKSPYYFGNNKKLNTLLLTENKKKIEIGNSNVQISIPSGLKLKESNGFINNYLYEKKSFELHGYYLEKEIFLPIFIFNESFEEFLKTENLVKLNENTYLNFEKNSKNRKLDQIIKKIDDNVFAVVSIVDMNDKSKNFFLELMKDW